MLRNAFAVSLAAIMLLLAKPCAAMPSDLYKLPKTSALVKVQNDQVAKKQYAAALVTNSRVIAALKAVKNTKTADNDFYIHQAEYDRAVILHRLKRDKEALTILRRLFDDPKMIKNAQNPPDSDFYFSAGSNRQFYSEFANFYESLLLDHNDPYWKVAQATSLERMDFLNQRPIDIFSSEYLSRSMQLAAKGREYARAISICELRKQWHEKIAKQQDIKIASFSPVVIVENSYISHVLVNTLPIDQRNAYYVAETQENCADVYEQGGDLQQALTHRQTAFDLGGKLETQAILFKVISGYGLARLHAKMGELAKSAEHLKSAINAASQPNDYGFNAQSICDFILKDEHGNDVLRAINLTEFSETKALLQAANCKIG